MKPEKRQQEIVKRLRAIQKELRVEELASAFNVSPLSIRRDLDRLEKEGAVLRTHGGCVAMDQAAYESEYHDRVARNFDLKQAIGKRALKEVGKGDTILLNDGSTTFHLAANLNGYAPLTVYTNSIAMINELSRNPGIRLHIIGGYYRRETHSLGGGIAERILEMLMFDTVFIGTDGINPQGYCLVDEASEARATQMMLRSGRRKVLLADHTKVGSKGNVAYGILDDFDMWITTKGVPKKLLRKFRKKTAIVEITV